MQNNKEKIGYQVIKKFNTYKIGDKFLFGESDGITSYVHALGKDSSLIPSWLCESMPEYFEPIFNCKNIEIDDYEDIRDKHDDEYVAELYIEEEIKQKIFIFLQKQGSSLQKLLKIPDEQVEKFQEVMYYMFGRDIITDESIWQTVGGLKKWIKEHNIPDDAKIYYQRIEDVYFNKHGWNKNVVKKPGLDDFFGIDEFVEVNTPMKYPDDNNLYLTAHY